MSDIKCEKCGFSDNGTGDTAHACSVVNKHNINLIAELQAENQRLRAIIEHDNVEPVGEVNYDYIHSIKWLVSDGMKLPDGAKLYLHPPKDSTEPADVCKTCPNNRDVVCAYCDGTGICTDTENQEWPCPQGCTEPASKLPDGYSLVKNEMLNFLHGTGEIDGLGFGDKHPDARGNFWWRRYLFEATLAAAPTTP